MNLRYTILLLSVSATLTACSGGMDDLRNFVAAEKAKKPGPIEPLPQIQPYENFTYSAQDLRSPFVPDTPVAAAPSGGSTNGITPDLNRNREYLESFPLDSLDMVGTLTFGGVTYALVRDPEGSVHRVSVGNYMGQNYGEITLVTPSEIKLIEIVPDGLGGWMEREAAIALNDE
ncbi:MAG TPA: pilus assembly protein PilP [Gammaproteobacteria bacterium]|nr:pilus assembly protein PilP [Gammaproteobacteria bacterium]